MSPARLAVWPNGAAARPALCTVEGHVWWPAACWLLCACTGSIPGHAERPDPAGGPGCAMAWRQCGRCDHIAERPATELPDDNATDNDVGSDQTDEIDDEHRAGGFLCQDVPAGPALPNPNTTSEYVRSEENAMVEATTRPAGSRGGAR